jgi:hypothetical protein
MLQWVKEPHLAIAEFGRVSKAGATVVCANFDGFAVTHWPEDPVLQPVLERVFSGLVDPFVGRKMAPMFRQRVSRTSRSISNRIVFSKLLARSIRSAGETGSSSLRQHGRTLSRLLVGRRGPTTSSVLFSRTKTVLIRAATPPSTLFGARCRRPAARLSTI